MPNILQPSLSAGVLAPSLWGRVDLAKYQSGARQLHNMIVHSYGGASNTPGTLFVGDIGEPARFFSFKFSTTQVYMLVFMANKLRIIKDGGFVIDPNTSNIAEIAHGYDATEIFELSLVQSKDVVFIDHQNHAPAELTRLDHHDWDFSDTDYIPQTEAPTGVSKTVSGLIGSGITMEYKVSAVDSNGVESLCGNTVSVPYNGTWSVGNTVTISWTAVAGAESYNIYKSNTGNFGWVGTVQSDKLSFKDNNIEPDVTDGPRQEANPFNEAGDYPMCNGIYQQRMIHANTINRPENIFGTVSGTISDMSKSSPLKDTDAYEHKIDAGTLSDVRHLIPMKGIFTFTGDSVWKITASDGSKAITPTSANIERISQTGCLKYVKPLVIGSTILFVSDTGNEVFETAYSLKDDGYEPNDLTVLADHLFRDSKVKCWAYQKSPDSIIWVVMEDGSARTLTYLKKHEIWAWTSHSTAGEYLWCDTMNADGFDEVYFVVKRTVNGAEKYFIERLSERLTTDDVTDSYFFHSGVRKIDPAGFSEIDGLDHLEGETVSVFYDGFTTPDQIVTGGKITLPTTAYKAAAGIPYSSNYQSLTPTLEGAEGSTYGTTARVGDVKIRFDRTGEVEYSTDGDAWWDIPFRTDEAPGEPTRLVSGIKELATEGNWDTEMSLHIRQTKPYPFTISSIVPEVII